MLTQILDQQSQALRIASKQPNKNAPAINRAPLLMDNIDNNIGPRLLQPTEDQYYRSQNQDFEERCARAQANDAWRQQLQAAAYPPGHQQVLLYNGSGWDSQYHQGARYYRPSQAQQQQIPSYAKHRIQTQIHPAHIQQYHGLPHLNTSVQHTQSMSSPPTALVNQPLHQPVHGSRIQPKRALIPS
jgi:hypothetical protein